MLWSLYRKLCARLWDFEQPFHVSPNSLDRQVHNSCLQWGVSYIIWLETTNTRLCLLVFSRGGQHYMTFEERNLLPIGTWNDTEQLFFPSKVLDLVHLAHPYVSERLYKDIVLLSCCTEDKLRTYLADKKEDGVKDYESSLHIAWWQNPVSLFKIKNSTGRNVQKEQLGSHRHKE